MRQLLSILCTLMFLGLFYNQAEAQSLMQTAKEAEQRAKEARQQEIARYDEIVDSKVKALALVASPHNLKTLIKAL